MIDKVAVVENVAATLLHNWNFTSRGGAGVYEEGSVYAMRKERIVVEGVYNSASRMYYWDLDNLFTYGASIRRQHGRG
jgi:hypothetical protein